MAKPILTLHPGFQESFFETCYHAGLSPEQAGGLYKQAVDQQLAALNTTDTAGGATPPTTQPGGLLASMRQPLNRAGNVSRLVPGGYKGDLLKQLRPKPAVPVKTAQQDPYQVTTPSGVAGARG